jgi:hypothetical protein
MVWLSILFLLLAIGFLGLLCYNKAKAESTNSTEVNTAQDKVQTGTDDNGDDEDTRKALEIAAYILWGLDIVLIIALCCFYNRI